MENNQAVTIDDPFVRTLKISRKRVAERISFINGETSRHVVNSLNSFIYFYRFFETRIAISKGDVFVARFEDGLGNELVGNHYVVALLDSDPICQVVTVVPLKSNKGRELNPASDIEIGQIPGLNNGKESIAVINQIRTIDKRRLFEADTMGRLYRYMTDEYGDYKEIPCQQKRIIRLTDLQYWKIHKAVQEYVFNGFIKHD